MLGVIVLVVLCAICSVFGYFFIYFNYAGPMESYYDTNECYLVDKDMHRVFDKDYSVLLKSESDKY